MSHAACKAETNMPANTLITELFAAPYRFEFAQAIALLEKCNPSRTPVGTGLDPRQETVRLSGPLYPLFYASALGEISQQNEQLCLQVFLFGLGGPDGPLPYAYQDWLQARRLQKDHSPAAFLDLFHQRILGQLYRVQSKHRIAAPFASPQQSPIQPVLQALTGILPKALHHRLAISDAALLAHTPILANRRRSAEGFKALVKSYWSDAISISPFDGAWSDIPNSHISCIGSRGQNQCLGKNAMAGKKVWDEHAGIKLILGPLSLEQYFAYLPTGALYPPLMALVAFYFGSEMRCRLVLKLADSAKTANDYIDGQPATPMAKSASPFLLGLSTWLGSPQPISNRQCQVPSEGSP